VSEAGFTGALELQFGPEAGLEFGSEGDTNDSKSTTVTTAFPASDSGDDSAETG
jgi:hypothetical protein